MGELGAMHLELLWMTLRWPSERLLTRGMCPIPFSLSFHACYIGRFCVSSFFGVQLIFLWCDAFGGETYRRQIDSSYLMRCNVASVCRSFFRGCISLEHGL